MTGQFSGQPHRPTLSTGMNIELVGSRTHCRTAVTVTTRVEAEIRESATFEGELWLHLTAGSVTGWESAPLAKIVNHMHDHPAVAGWEACFGTQGRFDRLVVTRGSIIAAFPEPLIDVDLDRLVAGVRARDAATAADMADAAARFVDSLRNRSHTHLEYS